MQAPKSGMTVRWNQIVPISSRSNLTGLTNNHDGTISLVDYVQASTSFIALTTTSDYFSIYSGRKYFIFGNPITGGNIRLCTSINSNTSYSDVGEGRIATFSSSSDTVQMSMRVVAGTYTFVIIPQIIDLTLMYGEGNEPSTVDEFKRQCTLNGIDLSVYHTQDITGTVIPWQI